MSTEYFMHLVLHAMKYRKESHTIRPDMINMLMEARGMLKNDNLKSHNNEWGNAFYFSLLVSRQLPRYYDVDPNLDGKPLTYDVIPLTYDIPALGTHRDPQYYKNPNKFDPERIREANKDNITPFTYLPFGWALEIVLVVTVTHGLNLWYCNNMTAINGVLGKIMDNMSNHDNIVI
uniref:Uncharacterized protein n=1 Tax=Glossina palpalis gambiensis TaxID=67801 RepID=A0A1B0B5P8_9MUSC